jgi:hypothetical protein
MSEDEQMGSALKALIAWLTKVDTALSKRLSGGT